MNKIAISRKTNETDIELNLMVHGKGNTSIRTGIGFMDHLLSLLAFHSGMDLVVKAKGDTEIDDHHLVEDLGIVLGQALGRVLTDKMDTERYGFALLPMDEVLVRAVVDLSGRSCLVFYAAFKRNVIGDLSLENIKEFFLALVRESGITLHLEVLSPGNDHHQAEALFKGFARALKQAMLKRPGTGLPSTKGKL